MLVMMNQNRQLYRLLHQMRIILMCRREYEQRKNGGFEIIDGEIREVILGVSLVSVLLLLFKLFFASLTGIVFV